MKCVEMKLNKVKEGKKRTGRLKDEDKQILTEDSRSRQSWSNVPRFHMKEKGMGVNEKMKKDEKINK